MARVQINKIEKLEMELPDGTIKEALFNLEAIKIYRDEFGEIVEEEMLNKPYDFVSKILYCGMKVLDQSVTIDEATALVIGGGAALVEEILKILVDNYIAAATDEQKNLFWQEFNKYTEKLMANGN